LAEAEGTLKSYSSCNTLDEKEEQHSKYQVSFGSLKVSLKVLKILNIEKYVK